VCVFCTGSPTTRWASVALGAGVGIGAAYTECSYLFNGAPPKWSPKVSTVAPAHSEVIALIFTQYTSYTPNLVVHGNSTNRLC
jgi:hypothetical protein